MSWKDTFYEFLTKLPGGPSAIPYYGQYIIPQNTKYETLIEAANLGTFPTVGEVLYPAIIVAAMFGLLRTILTAAAFAVSSFTFLFIFPVHLHEKYIYKHSSNISYYFHNLILFLKFKNTTYMSPTLSFSHWHDGV